MALSYFAALFLGAPAELTSAGSRVTAAIVFAVVLPAYAALLTVMAVKALRYCQARCSGAAPPIVRKRRHRLPSQWFCFPECIL